MQYLQCSDTNLGAYPRAHTAYVECRKWRSEGPAGGWFLEDASLFADSTTTLDHAPLRWHTTAPNDYGRN